MLEDFVSSSFTKYSLVGQRTSNSDRLYAAYSTEFHDHSDVSQIHWTEILQERPLAHALNLLVASSKSASNTG